MKRMENDRTPWAYVLVIGGLLLLAANLGWLARVGGWLWALAFMAGGVAFLQHYRRSREWWALIPGFALLAIGANMLAGPWGSALFLALLGGGFAAIYATDHEKWWAIIPAGALFTLALQAWPVARGLTDEGWLFFLGLGLTFLLLTLLPEGQGRQKWATYPAWSLLAFAAFLFLVTGSGGAVLPLLMIIAGVYLLWRRQGVTLPKRAGTPPAGEGGPHHDDTE